MMGSAYGRVFLIAVVALTSLLNAGPITYIETGQLSGTLATAPLTNVPFTFTFFGDTANITGTNQRFNVPLSNIITIGASNGSFTTTVETGVNNVQGIIGFSNLALTAGITFSSPGAIGYNLATPISVSNAAAFFASGSFVTSLGTLTVTSAQNLNFTATTDVPEPTPFAVTIGAILGIACSRCAKATAAVWKRRANLLQ